MAWNEPGGNSNNQDPWGGRDKKGGGDRQGPPDLDEALRKLQDRLNNAFGGGRKKSGNNGGTGGTGGSSGAGGSGKVIFLIAVLVLVGFWLSSAVYRVDEQERAVILRLGKYHQTVGPGLNIYFPPIDRKFQFNVTRERTYTRQGPMLTEDENILEVPVTVQYRISDLKDYALNVDGPEISLQQATESALRHVVGSTGMDQVITEGREVLAAEVHERLQSFLDNYGTGIVVTTVNVQNAQAPAEVQDAFDDVIRAREDEVRERNQAESYANGVIPEARGQAQRLLEEASGYRQAMVARAQGEAERFNLLVSEYQQAPEVMRERMFIETLQEVMSNTSKIMVSGDGNSNLLYLPIDKLMQQGGGSSSSSSAVPSAAGADANTRLPVQLQQRDVRTREVR